MDVDVGAERRGRIGSKSSYGYRGSKTVLRDSSMSGGEIKQGEEESLTSSTPGGELRKADISGTVLEEQMLWADTMNLFKQISGTGSSRAQSSSVPWNQ